MDELLERYTKIYNRDADLHLPGRLVRQISVRFSKIIKYLKALRLVKKELVMKRKLYFSSYFCYEIENKMKHQESNVATRICIITVIFNNINKYAKFEVHILIICKGKV